MRGSRPKRHPIIVRHRQHHRQGTLFGITVLVIARPAPEADPARFRDLLTAVLLLDTDATRAAVVLDPIRL